MTPKAGSGIRCSHFPNKYDINSPYNLPLMVIQPTVPYAGEFSSLQHPYNLGYGPNQRVYSSTLREVGPSCHSPIRYHVNPSHYLLAVPTDQQSCWGLVRLWRLSWRLAIRWLATGDRWAMTLATERWDGPMPMGS